MDEPADNDEEYDSDFGEDEFEDEQGTLNVAEIDLNIQGGRSMILLFGAQWVRQVEKRNFGSWISPDFVVLVNSLGFKQSSETI